MKYAILIIIRVLTVLLARNQSAPKIQMLQNRIDSLEQKFTASYRLGIGEFMSEIQVHHEKLWFAGQNQNWKLADFEINEIEESISAIKKYCTDRPESKIITMIEPPIDSIHNAIRMKSLAQFKSNYNLLTNTCNSCHQATSHEFNHITIPKYPPFSNQEFEIHELKK